MMMSGVGGVKKRKTKDDFENPHAQMAHPGMPPQPGAPPPENQPSDSVLAKVSGILCIMEMYSTNDELQQDFRKALNTLASCHDDNGVLIAHAIISEMFANPSDAPIQYSYCSMLEHLAKEIEAVRSSIVNKGGITLILNAMRVDTEDAKLQTVCCGALRWLALDSARHIKVISAEGGIQAILQAMKAHAKHAAIQESGCRALCNLACNDAENKATITAEGGIDAIASAMKEHADDFNLQKACCVVLYQMMNKPAVADAKELIQKAGAVEMVKESIKKHPEIKWVAQNVLSQFK